MSYVIANIIPHGAAVKEFHLRRADGKALPAWTAGAHVVLHFTDTDGHPYENHYSLIGTPGETDTYRIAVQREEGGKGGSRCLHDEIGIGSEVGLSGPFNSFPLSLPPSSGARVRLVGGGIGITPMISMAHALHAHGMDFTLHYLVHSAERLVLLDELCSLPATAIIPHVSHEAGRADLMQLLGPYRDGDACYACGPTPLLQALAQMAERLGWPANAMHFESFGARAQSNDATLMVELTLSQMTIAVTPGTSILDTLIAADVFVSYDCKRGECGNCYVQVLEGKPLHRDICLTPAMRAQGMCTCVSWASQERLVLEL